MRRIKHGSIRHLTRLEERVNCAVITVDKVADYDPTGYLPNDPNT